VIELPLAVLVAVALIPYWLGPILVWLTRRAGTRPTFEPFIPGRHPVPDDVAEWVRQACDALATEGFHVVADLFQTGQVRHISWRVALLENRATSELALAIACFTAARPVRIVASYVELPTKLADGRSVSVHNSPRPGSFTPPPSRVVVPLPIVRDPARLCRVKRAYLSRHYPDAERVPFERQGDPPQFLREAMVRELTEQVAAGTWWRDDRAGVFRPRFTTAWRMTWQALPPFSVWRRRRVRRRAEQILRELGMEGPDPKPLAEPRTRASGARVAALAGAVFVIWYLLSVLARSPGPEGAPRPEPVPLPAGFVVPDSFPDAVHALERLAAARAGPLIGTDSLGGKRSTEGFAVAVPAARAEGLVAAAQRRFLEKGFYLFRSEEHHGIQGQPDQVALFPRPDPYEILRLMGTNGWNYGIGPDSIVAWLRALGRDHPFILTGIGFDWLEGRFRSAIPDAGALARRFYAFCPDIVDQGTETVEALARELAESQRLYCWWD
jgi:hypothetical protein